MEFPRFGGQGRFTLGSFAGLEVSESTGLFGFVESGYRPAILLSIARRRRHGLPHRIPHRRAARPRPRRSYRALRIARNWSVSDLAELSLPVVRGREVVCVSRRAQTRA